ncbi:hypothetical protein [Saccharothrix violaceirubra]|uniref:Uncharacterized protein n=1 Tax=Saccharothrix violaceirubra TaxID=413306 RepID=A0A7W7WZT9_9PSEU|nr:hypothetical protein [Saccharothrix violaceirubra]MBB4969226.1 hypothetical protein [Saccharothrix violaceirubra]
MAALVAVLIVVAAAGWALASPAIHQTARTVPPTGERGRQAANPLAIANLGPGGDRYAWVTAFPQVEGAGFLGTEEVGAYNRGGADAARLAVWNGFPAGRVIIVVVRVADASTATRVADRLDELQAGFGLQRLSPVRGLDRVSTVTFEGRFVTRALYTHHDLVVRIELRGDPDELSAFDGIVSDQLHALPAEG